jgi:hypothetical protein
METDALPFFLDIFIGNTVAETLLLMDFVYHLVRILLKRIDIE